MERIYRLTLETLLPATAAGDGDMLARIAQYGGELGLRQQGSQTELVFTLPALFSFAVAHYNRLAGGDEPLPDNRESYGRFRELLFARPPNEVLQIRGLQVVLEQADLDPRRVTYRLIRSGAA